MFASIVFKLKRFFFYNKQTLLRLYALANFIICLPPEIARERGPWGQAFVWQGHKGERARGRLTAF